MNIDLVNNNLFAQIQQEQLNQVAAESQTNTAQTVSNTDCHCVTNWSC